MTHKKDKTRNKYKSVINHQLLSFIEKRRNPREIRDHLTAMADQQQFLGIGRKTQVGRRLTLGQFVNPGNEVTHASGAREGQEIIVLDTRDELVVVFECGGGKEAVDQVLELLVVVRVVDLAAVHLGDKSADHLPGNLLRCNIGTALRDAINPVVDDVG